jgi:2',3'-cyclic-nucleotide 2'-phosphodiesterase (5'-nucleotidase family)
MHTVNRLFAAHIKKLFVVFIIMALGLTAGVTTSFADITIFHVNDTHARVTPHKWIINQHGTSQPVFEDVGGAAYLASEMLRLTAGEPDAIVIDGGDISEGNPIGDMINPALCGDNPGGVGSNCTMTQFYTLLSNKLRAQRGRGMDAVVVGNHDVRDVNYINNLVALQNSGVPVVSVNVRNITTHQPYFAPYTIVTVNGIKVGILGYTTSASEVGASLSSTLEVATCDWNNAGSPNPPYGTGCHLAAYVNDLRNNQGCSLVILAAHVGHSGLVDPDAPLLVDDGAAKLPEVAVTGHWHTWADTVWQPEMLNYKTIFTESASYMKYIGELNITNTGSYVSSVQHVVRSADLDPDPDAESFIDNLISQYNAAHPGHPVDEVIGYTADNLMLDNVMKWWSADEYPWSGNNTAGQWICDAMQWKAAQLFGSCDLAFETGGGVRADIPAGWVTYLQIYETFLWNDDTFSRVNMTGQEIVNFLRQTNMDAGFSAALDVTAFDGMPTSVKFNGQPIDLNHTYTVAINNYMYAHPPTGWTWSDTNPLTSSALCRDGIVEFMRTQHPDQAHAYSVGGARYHLNTELSGGYRAVVTMMNDNDSKPAYEDAFIRFLSATPETLARRGSNQVPSDLVNADGTINSANRLSEQELYRSYLGFKSGALRPGDIIETWGKGSSYGGNPEFVDQEGIYANGVEFKIVGHDDSLAKPAFMSSIGAFWNDNYKNHYVQFIAKKTGTSTVADEYGTTITIMDATAYAPKTLPGNMGDMLLISGVPTMESYGLRFRCDNASVTAAPFPPVCGPSSHVDATPPGTISSPLTLSATATPCSSLTYNLTPVADSYVGSGRPTSNYGTSTTIYIQSSSTSTYGNERGWLKFDLSSIPAGATITGATLQLYNWAAAGVSLPSEVRGGNDDTWNETGITWNNQPAFGDVLDTQTLAAGTYNLWYNWNVTPFVQSKWSGNKLVSLVIKPVTEGSPDATAPSYKFDTKEYSSNHPVLQVTTTAGTATLTQVEFFYRYSSDNATWSAWTPAGITTVAPYLITFNYPNGYGYYEFYSRATDSLGTVEPIPADAQAFTHYSTVPAYYPLISIDNLYQRYDGQPKSVTVTTIPSGTSYSVTYDGNPTSPVNPGTYAVTATATLGGNTAMTTDVLTIGLGTATVNISNLNQIYDGTGKSVNVSTVPAGLSVSVTYNSSPTPPITAGNYAVLAEIADPNYAGWATATLIINKAPAIVTFGNLTFTYDGSPKIVSVTTNPAGLSVVVTYNGSQTPPSAVGSSMVVATVTDPNYGGTAYGNMTIAGAAEPVAVAALGLWGLLAAAGALGILGLRKRKQ